MPATGAPAVACMNQASGTAYGEAVWLPWQLVDEGNLSCPHLSDCPVHQQFRVWMTVAIFRKCEEALETLSLTSEVESKFLAMHAEVPD